MTQIKRVFFVLLLIIIFRRPYDSIVVKAEEAKNLTDVVDQKSEIEEQQRTIYIEIQNKKEKVVEIFIEQKKQEIEKQKKLEEPIIKEEKQKEKIVNNYNSYGIIISSLTPQDKELICRIAYLEAGNQCVEGQRAVIEVILNRLTSAAWPNTIEGVLSSPHQFSTWKNKDIVSNEQIIQMNNILDLVCYSNNTILPDNNYVYFNNNSPNKDNIKIQDHWFWK